MWLIVKVWYQLNKILNCENRTGSVRFMMKKRQENDVTDRTCVIYVEIGTELSWMIKQVVVNHKN